MVGSHSPPTAITIHNHLRRFPVEREEQSRGREGLGGGGEGRLGMTEKTGAAKEVR